jgi:hypothetical protein
MRLKRNMDFVQKATEENHQITASTSLANLSAH